MSLKSLRSTANKERLDRSQSGCRAAKTVARLYNRASRHTAKLILKSGGEDGYPDDLLYL